MPARDDLTDGRTKREFSTRIGVRRIHPVSYWRDGDDIHIILTSGEEQMIATLSTRRMSNMQKARRGKMVTMTRDPYLSDSKLERLAEKKLAPRSWRRRDAV